MTANSFLPSQISHLFKVTNGNTRIMSGICSKLTKKKRHQNDVIDVVLVSLLLILNRSHALSGCFHCWLWTSKSQLCSCYPRKLVHAESSNRNTRKGCEIYSKVTIKAPERHQELRYGIFVINFEHISHLFLVLLLLLGYS